MFGTAFTRNFAKIFKNPLTNFSLCDIIAMLEIWVWRRLVARYLGVVEAAGSNPVTQTNKNRITEPFVRVSQAALFFTVNQFCADFV